MCVAFLDLRPSLITERGPSGGMVGSFVGSVLAPLTLDRHLTEGGPIDRAQVGFSTGNNAARNVIRTEGDEQRITQALEAAVKGAQRQVNERVRGTGSPRPMPPSSSPIGRGDAPSGSFEQPRDESFYDSQTVHDSDTSTSAQRPATSNGTTSRWDELRKAQASPPSRWDVIREESGRARIGNTAQQGGDDDDGMDRLGAQAQRERDEQEQSYDERRQRFEEMMQREAKGGDDSFK